MLKINDAIRIEKYYPPNKNGGCKNVYIFKCIQCDNEIKIKARSRLKNCTGLCVKCNNHRMHPKALEARRLRPFEALFNRLNDSAKQRNISVSITYEIFLNFILIDKCHYCLNSLKRQKYGPMPYYLDRKDNKKGYDIDNIVACCSRCNKGKRELYSYEEWFGMTDFFRKQRSR